MSDELRRLFGEVVDALEKPFPKSAIKQRTIGGGKKADYVDGATVIRRLNEATGHQWSFTVDRYWTENNVTLALVTLTIPGMGSRQHIGVQSVGGSGEDAAAKGAITDGLKKAATLFGVALDLYGPDYEASETDQPKRQQTYQSKNQGDITPQAARPGRLTQLDVRAIKDHATKHKVKWETVTEHAYATYQVNALNELTKEQGRALHRWIPEQGRQASQGQPLDPQLNPEGL